MKEDYYSSIAEKLGISVNQVKNTMDLFKDGATIPFIARYRKELTGSLDETVISEIQIQLNKLVEIDKRRLSILKTIEDQGKLTPELRNKIENAKTLTELEDIYLPYKPKKKTRGVIAIENGLEPLAKIIMKQNELNIYDKASQFTNDNIKDVEDALSGARDIIAEWINENQRARNTIRKLFDRESFIYSKVAKGKSEEGIKYKDYFDFHEPLKKCVSHRMLAMRRGEKEGFLKIKIGPDDEKSIESLEDIFVKGYYDVSDQVRMAIKDCLKRLLGPSIENEYKAVYKEKADDEAIKVFAENLRQLMLAPPLGQKRILAIDPGFRTGCKIICLDEQGNLLHNETIFPHPPQNEKGLATKKINSLVNSCKIEAIAIGNGTASRETEHFVKKIKFDRELQVFVVSESGASIYSASKVAREEFPQYDVTVRGAVSIGRRLMDPLAELVKIDPKSIGVGQYQHDVDQKKLKESLDQVVESCVNSVGVNINTASKHLLSYVSGLGPQLAENIVAYRKENGAFKSRNDIKQVNRMGEKAFEQSAGFLRIRNGLNPLDNSAVHPESYYVVEKIASDLQCLVEDLLNQSSLRSQINLNKYITQSIGMPTLLDIKEELEKPGLDPRTKVKVFEFSPDLYGIEDVKTGMVVPGIITNITNFGAFVDIGVKQDGLVHISNLADRFIKDPNEIVKLHQHVKVKVIEVDIPRKRIQLSMKDIN